VQESCCSTVVKLLESQRPELIHRALVLVSNLIATAGKEAAVHLLEGGVVSALSVVVGLGDAHLGGLARGVAEDLSRAIKTDG
jgi:hypothetical protein